MHLFLLFTSPPPRIILPATDGGKRNSFAENGQSKNNSEELATSSQQSAFSYRLENMNAEGQTNRTTREFWCATLHFAAWTLIVPWLATSLWLGCADVRKCGHGFLGFIQDFLLIAVCTPFAGLYGIMVNALVTIPGAFAALAIAGHLKSTRSRLLFNLCGVAGGASWAMFINYRLKGRMDGCSLIVIGALAGFALAKITTTLFSRREKPERKQGIGNE